MGRSNGTARTKRGSHRKPGDGTAGVRGRPASGTPSLPPLNGRVLRICAPDLTHIQLPRIARRRSSVHGLGVFAVEPIRKNTRIVAYTGEKISHRESLRRERQYLRAGNIWCFRLNRSWVVDGAVGGSDARFINHSCSPNCYSQIVDGIIWIRAARNIAAGEELSYDYHTEGAGRIPCRCRPDCPTEL